MHGCGSLGRSACVDVSVCVPLVYVPATAVRGLRLGKASIRHAAAMHVRVCVCPAMCACNSSGASLQGGQHAHVQVTAVALPQQWLRPFAEPWLFTSLANRAPHTSLPAPSMHGVACSCVLRSCMCVLPVPPLLIGKPSCLHLSTRPVVRLLVNELQRQSMS